MNTTTTSSCSFTSCSCASYTPHAFLKSSTRCVECGHDRAEHAVAATTASPTASAAPAPTTETTSLATRAATSSTSATPKDADFAEVYAREHDLQFKPSRRLYAKNYELTAPPPDDDDDELEDPLVSADVYGYKLVDFDAAQDELSDSDSDSEEPSQRSVADELDALSALFPTSDAPFTLYTKAVTSLDVQWCEEHGNLTAPQGVNLPWFAFLKKMTRAESFADFVRTHALGPQSQPRTVIKISRGKLKDVVPVAKGAFGEVYRARHKLRGTKYFVKEQAADSQFLAELSTMCYCTDLGLNVTAHLIGLGVDGGTVVTASEVVRGVSLEAFVASKGGSTALSLEERLRVMAGCARVVSVLHAHGIVHNDIALRNMMCDERFEVSIIDFGLSVVLADSTGAEGAAFIHSKYPMAQMPSEFFETRSCSLASDVYQLGLMLFEVLCGEDFVGDSLLPALRATSSRAELVEVASSVRPDFGTWADRLRESISADEVGLSDGAVECLAIIQRCLAADPSARPSANEVYAVCGRLIGEPWPSLELSETCRWRILRIKDAASDEAQFAQDLAALGAVLASETCRLHDLDLSTFVPGATPAQLLAVGEVLGRGLPDSLQTLECGNPTPLQQVLLLHGVNSPTSKRLGLRVPTRLDLSAVDIDTILLTLKSAEHPNSTLAELQLSDTHPVHPLRLGRTLRKHSSITSIRLHNPHDKAVVALMISDNLERACQLLGLEQEPHIQLRAQEIADVSALGEALRDNATITSIDLSENHITDVTPLAEALRDNSTLTSLDISSNSLTDVSPLGSALHDNSTLTTLNLSFLDIADVSLLAKALHTNSTLTSLDVSRTKLVDVTPLTDALRDNSALTTLDLSYCNIADVAPLAELLRHNSALTTLYLINCTMIADVSPLVGALAANTTLTTLNLANCNIVDISTFSNALAENTTLTTLNLTSCRVVDISPLYSALHENNTLTTLILTNCNVVDISALSSALAENTTLTTLDLMRCSITDVSPLIKALHANTTLATLNLSYNSIPSTDKDLLRSAWNNRSPNLALSG